jgi:hypothetical protein
MLTPGTDCGQLLLLLPVLKNPEGTPVSIFPDLSSPDTSQETCVCAGHGMAGVQVNTVPAVFQDEEVVGIVPIPSKKVADVAAVFIGALNVKTTDAFAGALYSPLYGDTVTTLGPT